MPGISKGFSYSSKNKVVCELCGKEFKTRSGLGGHMRFYHGTRDSEEQSNIRSLEQPAPVISPSPSNRELREAVERARLQSELAKFGVTPQQPLADISQQMGAGELDPTIKQQLQSRMFTTQPPPEPKPSL